jgi:hypothetical protein
MIKTANTATSSLSVASKTPIGNIGNTHSTKNPHLDTDVDF